MQPINSLALKEWAVVVHALASGKQVLLLRKGGLYERHGRFSIEPTEFFFFPTYVHQMEQGMVSAVAAELQSALATRPPENQLVLSHYAVVSNVQWIAAREHVAALSDFHCWTPETVETRFTYKTVGLYLFILRVYQLSRPHALPMLKRYAGCRSWVELEESLSTHGVTPVLSERAFAERAREIHDRLCLH